MTGIFQAPASGYLGNSQVVDDRGYPLIVYHGTRTQFYEFDMDCARDLGLHFGTIDQARHFADKDGVVFAAYLSIERPLRLIDTFDAKITSAQDTLWHLERQGVVTPERARVLRAAITSNFDYGDEGVRASWALLREAIQEAGFDGVAYENANDAEGPGACWIVFDANQIQVRAVIPVRQRTPVIEDPAP